MKYTDAIRDLAMRKARYDFQEAKHPRAEDGEFTDGGTATKKSKALPGWNKSPKSALAPPTQHDIDSFRRLMELPEEARPPARPHPLPGWGPANVPERKVAPREVDPDILDDVHKALLSLGHKPREAKAKLKELQESGNEFKTVESALEHLYTKQRNQESERAFRKALYHFNESQHPRGQPENAGQFIKGHAQSARAGFEPLSRKSTTDEKTGRPKLSNEFAHAEGRELHPELHERAKKLALPPAWTGVQVAADPKSPLQAVGFDSKGRMQYRYSSEHSDKQAAAKFHRVKQFVGKLPAIREKIQETMRSGSHADREAAAVLSLIDKTGFRVGSERNTGAEVQAHGATTLDASHVDVSGDKVTFKFIGKKGVAIEQTIRDAGIAKMIGARQAQGGKLFHTTDSEVRDFLHKIAGNFKVKDFRTAVAADTALQAIESIPAPKNDKEFKQKRSEVGTIVSAKLGNTATVALASYIPPEVFQSWQANLTKFNDSKSSSTAPAMTGSPPAKKSKPSKTTATSDADVAAFRKRIGGAA